MKTKQIYTNNWYIFHKSTSIKVGRDKMGVVTAKESFEEKYKDKITFILANGFDEIKKTKIPPKEAIAYKSESGDIWQIDFNQCDMIDFDLEQYYFDKLKSISFSDCDNVKNANMYNAPALDAISISDSTLLTLPDWMQNLNSINILILNTPNLSAIPDWISCFTNLQFLLITISKIKDIPKGMQGLTNLQYLLISYTQLTALPSWIDIWGNIEFLSFSDNQICELPESLKQMKKLKTLGISNNKITVFPKWLKDIPNLNSIYASGNPFISLPDNFDEYNNLSFLGISDLYLDLIPPSIIKTKLPFVFYSGEPEKSTFHGINLENTKLKKMDISLFEQPREVIEAFYSDELVPIHECKVVFLGDGEAGKSSLIQCVIDGECEKNKRSTDGIEIRQWPLETEIFNGNIRFWDFGGQEIMHSMHKCFLTSRSIYVIVLNARENEFIDRKATHWLDTVQTFAPNSPVILVINKIDLSESASLNERTLREHYPQIKESVIKTSAIKNYGIRELADAVIRQVSQSEGYMHYFNKRWFNIKKKLEEVSRPYIEYEEYKKFCEEEGMTAEYLQKAILNWFKDLGVSFFYKGKEEQEARPSMEKYNILNPDWLTNGIYRLILRSPDNSPFIPHSILKTVIGTSYEHDVKPNLIYSDIELEYILYVMRLFKLSYKFPKDNVDYEFIPSKCQKDSPAECKEFKNAKCLHLSWEGKYIPFNALYQLMIDLFNNLDKDKVWKYGAFFRSVSNNQHALVEMSLDETSIDIYVQAEHGESKEYLSHFREHLRTIFSNLNLSVDEYIHYKDDEKGYGKEPFSSVITQYHMGAERIYLRDIASYISPMKLLQTSYTQKDIDLMKKDKINDEASVILKQYIDNRKIDFHAGDASNILYSDHQIGDNTLKAQQIINSYPEEINKDQLKELQDFINLFLASGESESITRKQGKDLEEITKEASPETGWQKFKQFLAGSADVITVAGALGAFAAKHGPEITAWIAALF